MNLNIYSDADLRQLRRGAEIRHDWALAIRVTVELARRRKAKLAKEGAA